MLNFILSSITITMIDMSELYKKINEKIGDMEINTNTIIKVLKFSMECVEATQLKGDEKKNLAIKLVRMIVDEAPITESEEILLMNMIDQGILHNMVDLVVDAKSGKIDINLLVGTGCCASFLKRT
tara:strand:+ start:800 stop:1177 length:378 start_codon:yes stop_codon:yes gene_type:complete